MTPAPRPAGRQALGVVGARRKAGFCLGHFGTEARLSPGVEHGFKRLVVFVTGHVGALLVSLDMKLAEDRLVYDFPRPSPGAQVQRLRITEQAQDGGEDLVPTVNGTVSLSQAFLDAGSYLRMPRILAESFSSGRRCRLPALSPA